MLCIRNTHLFVQTHARNTLWFRYRAASLGVTAEAAMKMIETVAVAGGGGGEWGMGDGGCVACDV